MQKEKSSSSSSRHNTVTRSAVTHHTERSKCRKLMTGPETKKMVALVDEFKEKVSNPGNDAARNSTIWKLQLRLSMDMGLVALELLKFLDEVPAFEELATDVETDVIPYLDDVIEGMEEAGDPIFFINNNTTTNNDDPPPLQLLWKPDATHDAMTIQRLNQTINDINKVTTTVFTKVGSEIDMDGRFSIMRACHSLFEAMLDLVKSVKSSSSSGVLLEEYGDELVAMLEDAVVKCSSEELAEYYYYGVVGGEIVGDNDD